MNTNTPLPPTYLLVTIMVMMLVHLLFPVIQLMVMPWNLLGCAPLLLGVTVNILADVALKIHRTTVNPFDAPSVLITNRIYRVSRNPMYLGMVLILTGIAMLLGSLSPFFVILIFAVVMAKRFIAVEESILERHFAGDWQCYRHKTRRWL